MCDRASRRPERTPPELSFNPSSMVCHKTVVRCCRHVTCERAGRWPAAAERKATCQLRARCCCCCCLNLGTRAAKRVCCAVSLSESMHPVAASDLQAWASRSLSRCFLVSCARALARARARGGWRPPRAVALMCDAWLLLSRHCPDGARAHTGYAYGPVAARCGSRERKRSTRGPAPCSAAAQPARPSRDVRAAILAAIRPRRGRPRGDAAAVC